MPVLPPTAAQEVVKRGLVVLVLVEDLHAREPLLDEACDGVRRAHEEDARVAVHGDGGAAVARVCLWIQAVTGRQQLGLAVVY